jgi:hypothetical protein
MYIISKTGKVSKVIDGKFKKYSSWVDDNFRKLSKGKLHISTKKLV